jgi:plasmid stabilization system protein ParE
MPVVSLEFDPEAIEEARAARAWYGERSRRAEVAYLAELRQALQRIREAPRRWPRFDHGTRRVVLHRFPFSVIYRIGMGDKVLILAVAHDKRRPGYWKRR